MTFTVLKSEFLARLQSAGKIISSKPINPVMSCFLLKVAEGRLHISATDAFGRIDTSIECQADEECGICIESGMLIDALKELPEQPVTFHVDANNLYVRIDYQGGKFEITGKDPLLFPEPREINNPQSINIASESFLEGINKTIFCAANDELRPVMNGMLIESGETGINYVSTDGHRLAMVEHMHGKMPKLSFVLPSKMASTLKGAMQRYAEGDISVTVGSHNITP